MTTIKKSVYHSSIATQLAIRIRLLNFRAHRRSLEALFLRPKSVDSMVGRMGHLRVAAPRSGKANPVRPATLIRFALVGGSSQLTPEGTIMSTNTTGQIRPLVTPEQAKYDFSELPFSEKINNQGLSRLSLWSVKPNGNYHEQIITGEAYAVEAIKCMQTNNFTTLLSWVVEDMRPGMPRSGIETGFLSSIAELAMFGSSIKAGRS